MVLLLLAKVLFSCMIQNWCIHILTYSLRRELHFEYFIGKFFWSGSFRYSELKVFLAQAKVKYKTRTIPGQGCLLQSLFMSVNIMDEFRPGGRQKIHSIKHTHSSVQFSRSVMSDSLRPHESQHARPPCPSPTPGVHWDSMMYISVCYVCVFLMWLVWLCYPHLILILICDRDLCFFCLQFFCTTK